ncbi:hypothetical protein BGZ94_009761 [Podila epigama]|nr:hypothetical protein BGZ94_009761 [Podila epigama]
MTRHPKHVRFICLLTVAVMLVVSTVTGEQQPRQQDTFVSESTIPGNSVGPVKEGVVAYDPLEPATDQLMLAVAAGVAPPPSPTDQESRKILEQKELRHVQRLETDRVEKHGSLYLEPYGSPPSSSASGRSRFSGEPLPWDGLADDDEVIGESGFEDDYVLQGSNLPWSGDLRYETLSEKESPKGSKGFDGQSTRQRMKSRIIALDSHADFMAFQVDQDDGADVVDEQSPSHPLFDSPSSKTHKSAEFSALGLEGQGDEDPSIKVLKLVDDSEQVPKARPKLDQIDFLEHEAEVDWLEEQEKMLRSWRVRHHHHQHHSQDEDQDEDENEDDDEDEVEIEWDSNSVDNDDESTADDVLLKSAEEIFNDPQWHKKHGGLNPKHYTVLGKENPFRSVSRVEKQDRDEDGTVFPDKNSRTPYSQIVYPSTLENPDSPLGYVAYNHHGDRIMDFSMVGWNEGNTELPDPLTQIPVLEQLDPRPGSDSDTDTGDDTDRIQSALNRVARAASAKVQDNTVVPTGALVLSRGIYRISRPLKIRASGILFRGDPAGGSRIVCQWEPTGPRYAIEIEGKGDSVLEDSRTPVMAEYTPVGSFFLNLDPSYFEETELAVGDKVILTRVGNERWVHDIGMDDFNSDKKGVKPWKKTRGRMYRTIRSLNPKTGIVQLDAPLPIAIERRYGGGWVTKYVDNKLRAVGFQFFDMVFPRNIGRMIEEMLDQKGRGSQDYRFSYEIFANYALRMDKVQHAYVSHITTAYFHNFVSVGSDAHHLTFDSIVHSYPDDMLSGQSAFQLSGQMVLISNSLSQGSFHFFVDINHVMGPNVIHRAQATNVGKAYDPMPLDFAPGEVGPHMKFCTGMLFDQVVTDGSIQIVNRGDMGTGQGYSGANSVIWNSRAREGILTHRARGTQNFVIGSEDFDAEDRQPWDSHGWKEHLGSEVLPGSLYLRQLKDRLERLSRGWIA